MLGLGRRLLSRPGALVGSAVAAGLSSAAAARCEPASNPKEADAETGIAATVAGFVPAPVKEAYDNAYYAVYDNIIKPYAEPSRGQLLPDVPPQAKGREKPTLVISLDGCLLESVWTRQHGWRYAKRPGVDQFLASLAPWYELVLWTETMNSGDPVVDKLDPRRLIRHRLYRDTTTFQGGFHRKDLSALNRDMNKVLIIDVAAESFSLQPAHGIEIPSYNSEGDPDKKDTALTKLVPWLQFTAMSRPADYSAEVAALKAQYPGEDLGDACEKKIAELKATGKLVVKGGRRAVVGGGDAAPKGGTVWERLRR